MIKFADEALITVSSGKGGDGCVAFRREKFIPFGGPAGGDGGRGGDIVFEVRRNLRTLAQLRYQQSFKAESGQPGMGKNMHGRDGADALILVPPGTIVWDADTGEMLKDFGLNDKSSPQVKEGEVWLFLKGGKGGWGNTHFKNSDNQAPRTFQPGQPAKTVRLRIELQLIADIGFVGFPNAGKSSLLDHFTNARPKIAPYPFTTKIPNLGMLTIHERDIVLADIPGIIEGAHDGAGLGLRFLKHISRTSALAFLVDLSDEKWEEAFRVLLGELSSFTPAMAGQETRARRHQARPARGRRAIRGLPRRPPGRVGLRHIGLFRRGSRRLREAFLSLFIEAETSSQVSSLGGRRHLRPRSSCPDEEDAGDGPDPGGRGLRLLVLGGSFNPVHLGHLVDGRGGSRRFGYDLACSCLLCGRRTRASTDEPGAARRVDMLRLAIGAERPLGVDLCEIERGGTSYTIDTLEDLSSRFASKERSACHRRRSGRRLSRLAQARSWRRRPTSSARTASADEELPFRSRTAMPTTVSCASRAAGSRPHRLGKPFRRLLAPASSHTSWRTASMDYAELCRALDGRLDGLVSPERAAHSRRVAELCESLCAREGIDPSRGRAAGLAHDMCKEMPRKAQRELASLYAASAPLDAASALMADKVMHGPAAAALLTRDYALTDEGILEAVAVHTVGRPGMGVLAALLYCADKLEPGRERPRDDFRRRCLKLPADEMLLAVVEGVVGWLRVQGKAVAPETSILYSTLVREADRR